MISGFSISELTLGTVGIGIVAVDITVATTGGVNPVPGTIKWKMLFQTAKQGGIRGAYQLFS